MMNQKGQGLKSAAQWCNQLNWDKVLIKITASITLPIFNKRVQNFLILLYKSLFFSHFPAYMKSMFSLQSSSYDLLSKPKIMTYGLKSFSYFQLNSGMQCQTFFALVFRHNFLIRLLCEDFYFMYFCVVSARIY